MLRDLAFNSFFGATPAARPVSVAGRKVSAAKLPKWMLMASGALLAANAVLLASYLVSVNSSAATGYEIKKMRTELAVLTEANQKLNVKVSQISSMVDIQEQVLSADFVPAGTPQFLQATQFTRR